MDVLTTRELKYTDDNGEEKDLVLTVFMPFEAEKDLWRCGFQFSPPIQRKIVFASGVDFLDAFVTCLRIARIHLESSNLTGRVRWGDMLDCGLPWHTMKPPESTRNVLTTRELHYRHESGNEGELLLTVFVPFKAEDESWRCGFTFGPPLNTSLAYGYGDDFTEALLDCIASAREALEILDPFGRIYSIDRGELCDFPRKIGRSFWMGTADEPPPDAPDPSGG
ncbi:MAG TPA: hypothetical protein VEX38_03495 [Fimbriimonadaceae bacterium]|jgi:hypothetical protein|nr:hypothetical protein [Fimbriimonadaceae bacterium]